MKGADFIRKNWSYIKRGKTELWFLLSVYNTILLYSSRYRISLSLIIMFITLIMVVFYIAGYYLINKVDIINPKILPFTQDNIQSAYFLNEGLICLSIGDHEGAEKFFIRSRLLRLKWINNESFDVDVE
jgi:uncharacterized protein HemY